VFKNRAQRRLIAIGGAAIILISLAGFFLFLKRDREYVAPASSGDSSVTELYQEPEKLLPSGSPLGVEREEPENSVTSATPQTIRLLSAASIANVAPEYDFGIYIPVNWEAEAIRPVQALNIFVPTAAATNLDRSQIFVRYFKASAFQTLSSVKIISRKETTVAGRPAVDYIIEKKPGYPNFPNQPTWRNGRHRVVDIRATDENPSLFCTLAQNPSLPDEVFNAILETFVTNPQGLVSLPLENFSGRVTKKPFGIFVTPQNSPVTPEKFKGYHTGADAEIEDTISATALIPVAAIADGTVERSLRAKGYGGVVAIRHMIDGKPYLAVYGHLNPKTLIPAGRQVKAGQPIGSLGRAFSTETDDERRHLHFGLYTGEDANIAGYVQKEADLSRWVDPLKFFADHMPSI